MAEGKRKIVLKLPGKVLENIPSKSIEYGLHLVAIGRRPATPIPKGGLKSVKFVLSPKAQAIWDSSLPHFPSKAALAATALTVVKEEGPIAHNIKF